MSTDPTKSPPRISADEQSKFLEEVELAGHIIDSLVFPKVLDEILTLGGRFEIQEVNIGQRRQDPSYARLQVIAPTSQKLEEILGAIGQHGAVPLHQQDCQLIPADMDGAFPEGFYSTTNQDTEIRLSGRWIPVDRQEMDCGIKVEGPGSGAEGPATEAFPEPSALDAGPFRAVCIPMSDVKAGDLIVVGRAGTRVKPLQRDLNRHDAFSFMQSTVSSEKPKGVTVREIAAEMQRIRHASSLDESEGRGGRQGTGKILVVAGPAVVHTGSREYFSHLIRQGYIDVLFAGNALAAHDIEQSFFETSLGISMTHGGSIEEGHEHHLRAINRIRRLGGIRQAVEQGVLTTGIMYECVKNDVPFLLAGSIRDDGPLPDVITDMLAAQRKMREMVEGVTLTLMIATTLHSIAVGNLLPARVKVVCIDINPATVTKLADRGTFQTVGLVTDVEPFLRVLVQELEGLAGG